MSNPVPNPGVAEKYEALVAQRREALAQRMHGIFLHSSDFVCEVGSGHGHFLTAYAQQHTDQLCVGIDIVGDRVDRANRKRDRAGLKHLYFLHAEAGLFLKTLPSSATISKVFILFPDPWPKKRHHKHRLIQPEFLTLLRSRVHPDTELFFRTDHQPYFKDAQAAVSEHAQWRLTDAAWPFEHETVFQQRVESYRSFSAGPRP